MSRLCATCKHADRGRIEFALTRHVPLRAIARQYQLNKDGLKRHQDSHMPAQLKAALAAKSLLPQADLDKLRVEESTGLLQHLVAQRGRLHVLGEQARTLGDIRAAVGVERAITANLELTGKLVGEFSEHAVQIENLLIAHPQYVRLRRTLIDALKPYPAARLAVGDALTTIEEEEGEITG